MYGEGATKLTDADRAKIMQELHLSDPLYQQYFRWMKDLASGKLGSSFFRGDNVADLILRRGPLSAEIGLLAVHHLMACGAACGDDQRAATE